MSYAHMCNVIHGAHSQYTLSVYIIWYNRIVEMLYEYALTDCI